MADSGIYPDKYLGFFDRHGVPRPAFMPHGVADEDIRSKMTQLKPTDWRQEGDWVIGETEMGELRLNVGTKLKLKGMRSDGWPELVDIDKL